MVLEEIVPKKNPRHGRDWLQRMVQRHHPEFDPRSSPVLLVAPMVDQSDLPFRLLCRKYGTHVCFTPMIHARLLCTCQDYRRKFLPRHNVDYHDRPLIAQLCGHDPDTVLQAAQMLAPYCDGIDLNCGCPQGIARRGNYGAFLLEQPSVLLAVVQRLVTHFQNDLPISVKVRLLPGDTREESLQNSLRLYRQLVDAGIAMLSVHGRTRHQKGHLTGSTDWEAIAQVVREFSHEIPIVANGGISSLVDAQSCWKETKADGVMSSEAILEHPALFFPNNNETDNKLGRVQLAREYLELAQLYPSDEGGQGSGIKCARMHLHRMLHADLQQLEELRQQVSDASSLHELELVLERLETIHQQQQHQVDKEELSWYLRHRQIVNVNGLMVNISEKKREHESTVKSSMDLGDDDAFCFTSLFDDE